jgi:hypothetical protein
MDVGIARVGDVDDFSIWADEKAHALVHAFALNPHTVKIRDFSVRVGEQREIQIVFGDELLVAVGGIKADADDLHVVLLQIAHAVTEAARFLRAAAGEIFRIKIEQDDFLLLIASASRHANNSFTVKIIDRN